jgi:purine-binding chemotaxis protein CheW
LRARKEKRTSRGFGDIRIGASLIAPTHADTIRRKAAKRQTQAGASMAPDMRKAGRQMRTREADAARVDAAAAAGDAGHAFVTFMVGGQTLGIPVTRVQDILTPEAIARVPLGPPEVRGLINLRGRIVTVIDMRMRLGLAVEAAKDGGMCVTVENEGELYTLLVDGVGDVVSLPAEAREPVPPTLAASWTELADGVFRMGGALLVALDIAKLLDIRRKN